MDRARRVGLLSLLLLTSLVSWSQTCEIDFHTEAASLMTLSGHNASLLCDATSCLGEASSGDLFPGIVNRLRVVWKNPDGREVTSIPAQVFAVAYRSAPLSRLMIMGAERNIRGRYTCSVERNGVVIQERTLRVIVFNSIDHRGTTTTRRPRRRAQGRRRGDTLIEEEGEFMPGVLHFRPVRSALLYPGLSETGQVAPLAGPGTVADLGQDSRRSQEDFYTAQDAVESNKGFYSTQNAVESTGEFQEEISSLSMLRIQSSPPPVGDLAERGVPGTNNNIVDIFLPRSDSQLEPPHEDPLIEALRNVIARNVFQDLAVDSVGSHDQPQKSVGSGFESEPVVHLRGKRDAVDADANENATSDFSSSTDTTGYTGRTEAETDTTLHTTRVQPVKSASESVFTNPESASTADLSWVTTTETPTPKVTRTLGVFFSNSGPTYNTVKPGQEDTTTTAATTEAQGRQSTTRRSTTTTDDSSKVRPVWPEREESFFGRHGVAAFAITLAVAILLLYALLMVIFMPKILACRNKNSLDINGSGEKVARYKRSNAGIEETAAMTMLTDGNAMSSEVHADEDTALSGPSDNRSFEDEKDEGAGSIQPGVSTFLMRQNSQMAKDRKDFEKKNGSAKDDDAKNQNDDGTVNLEEIHLEGSSANQPLKATTTTDPDNDTLVGVVVLPPAGDDVVEI